MRAVIDFETLVEQACRPLETETTFYLSYIGASGMALAPGKNPSVTQSRPRERMNTREKG
jgi:hypothetical protein